MWALVGMLLALRAAGAEVGWGYQLQSPAMVGALALLVFAAALNMAGVFELAPVGGTLSVAAGRTPPAAEAFMSGVLVTALATPCSAPFLAAAVAYGIAGGAASAIVVFTALGLGLIWPLALVAVAPRVRRCLPKPAAGMGRRRRALGFPRLAPGGGFGGGFGRQPGAAAGGGDGVRGGAARAVGVVTGVGLGLVWAVALVGGPAPVARWLPKPGAWMVTLRQALAFPLFATVVWLAWVLGRQAGIDAVAM